MEKGTEKVKEWAYNYARTEKANTLIYGVKDEKNGIGYYAYFPTILSIVKWLAFDVDSEGFMALRVEPDKVLRRKVQECGTAFKLEEMNKYEGNRGERFEQLISEKLHVPYNGKDSRPYYIAADISADTNTRISCKFERCTVARIETIETAVQMMMNE